MFLCLLLCQCMVGPAGRWVTLKPSDRVVVSYQQGVDDGLRQTLCSGPQLSAREAYSRKGADPGLKVARLEDLQRLLDEFGQHRFGAKAQPMVPADVKQCLSVDVNGQIRVFAMLPEGAGRSQEDLVDFIACKQAFFKTFNATTGFTSGNTSVAELQKQQAELQERARRLKGTKEAADKTATNPGKPDKPDKPDKPNSQ